jgi:hypothetical protein
MDLLRNLFVSKRSVKRPEGKPFVAAPVRVSDRIITIVPDEPEAAPSPPKVPEESAELLSAKVRVRGERRGELEALAALEPVSAQEKPAAKMAELKLAVSDAIESDLDQCRFRVAFYLYQSAIHAARRSR